MFIIKKKEYLIKYNDVLYIIIGQDLYYLTDMFNWNYNAFKCTVNNIEYVNNKEIENIFNEAINLFDNNMNNILDILGGYNDK